MSEEFEEIVPVAVTVEATGGDITFPRLNLRGVPQFDLRGDVTRATRVINDGLLSIERDIGRARARINAVAAEARRMR